MTDLRKAAEMALEALLDAQDAIANEFSIVDAYADEIEAIRQALAQPDWTTDTPVPPFKYLDFAEYKGTGEDVKIKHSLAQPEQRENRMTDREAIQKALDTPHRRYSIKPHGNGYAIYRDRDLFHHGFNIGHLTEVTPETIELIENALNTTLAQPEQEPVAWMYPSDLKTFETNEATATAFSIKVDCPDEVSVPLYTAPPSKPWVSLTDREIEKAIVSTTPSFKPDDVAQAIEAALRSKNT